MTSALNKILDGHRKAFTRSQRTQAERMSKASRYEFVGCWANEGWQEQAMANLAFVRRGPKGFVTSLFMVDLGCQGVKDVNIVSGMDAAALEALLAECFPKPEKMTGPVAMAIMSRALDFAAKFEFAPHKDYLIAAALLRGIKPDKRTLETVIVGDGKGKPIYYYDAQGPDGLAQEHKAQLIRLCGKGGFRTVEIP